MYACVLVREGPPVQDGSFVHVIKACMDEYTLLQSSSWEEVLATFIVLYPSLSLVFKRPLVLKQL